MLQTTAAHLNDLPKVAGLIIPHLQKTPVLLVDAQMGAGKTTLVREICAQLGVTDEVSSPTYSIVNEYRMEKGESMFHFDLYRLKNVEEAYDIGIEDYLYSGKICIIEWPDLVIPLLPDAYLHLKISLQHEVRHYVLNSLPG